MQRPGCHRKSDLPEPAGLIYDIVQPLGEGMWWTATALGVLQRGYVDEITGNAVYFGIIEESGVRAIVSVRIRAGELTGRTAWIRNYGVECAVRDGSDGHDGFFARHPV